MRPINALIGTLVVVVATAASDAALARSGGHSGGGHRGSGHHHHGSHFRGGVFIGVPAFWYRPYYGYPYYYPGYYPPAYYPYAYPAGSATYVEQGDPQAAPPPPSTSQGNWWFYCAESQTYYPYVKECAGGWQRVAPQPPS